MPGNLSTAHVKMWHNVKVEILRIADTHQPSFVACVVRDTSGREWVLWDKAPIFSKDSLDEHSIYPQPGQAACEIVREWTDEQGRRRCLVDLEHPCDISTRDGEHQFEVFIDQIVAEGS
jgi:hypothetical protein